MEENITKFPGNSKMNKSLRGTNKFFRSAKNTGAKIKKAGILIEIR